MGEKSLSRKVNLLGVGLAMGGGLCVYRRASGNSGEKQALAMDYLAISLRDCEERSKT